MSPFDLGGRRILVTGAGQGIGAAIAAAVVARGGAVAANDLIDSRLEDLSARLNSDRVSTVVGDVADPEAARNVVEQAAEALGGLDGVVNNAGIVRFGTIRASSTEDWDRTMAVDFASVVHTSRASLSFLEERGGAIVNLASIAAVFPSVTVGSYSAAKAAVVAITKQMAIEWGPVGIRCNAIGPGLISGTSMTERADNDPALASARDAIVPLRRTGRPEDVADVAVFLLSDASRYVNGQLLMVDGGLGVSALEFVPRPAEQDQARAAR